MPSILQELYLPINTMCIILGYQIGIYLLYEYNRRRKDKLDLNLILLANSLLFLIANTGYMFQSISIYVDPEQFLKEFFLLLSYGLILVSVIVFLFIISQPAFKDISNKRITRIIAIVMIFPIITIFLFNYNSTEFLLSVASILIPLSYIALFQYRIIKITSKKIKRRLIQINIGEAISIISTMLGGELLRIPLFGQFEEIAHLFFMYCFLIGLIIVMNGVFNIPVLLEFKWQDNLECLYIFDSNTATELYAYEFQRKLHSIENQIEDITSEQIQTIFSNGLLGIQTLVDALSHSAGKKITEIEHGDSFILLNYSSLPNSSIVFALLAKRNRKSMQYFLKKIKKQFEGLYEDIITGIASFHGNERLLFSNFDVIVRNTLKYN